MVSVISSENLGTTLTLNGAENGLGWSKHTIGHDKTDAKASKQSKSEPSHLVLFEYVPDGSIA